MFAIEHSVTCDNQEPGVIYVYDPDPRGRGRHEITVFTCDGSGCPRIYFESVFHAQEVRGLDLPIVRVNWLDFWSSSTLSPID